MFVFHLQSVQEWWGKPRSVWGVLGGPGEYTFHPAVTTDNWKEAEKNV